MGGATFSSQKYDFHNLLFNKKVQNLETKIFFDGLTPVWDGVPLIGKHRTFCRFAPALTLCATAYATSLTDLNAATLDALTSRPRKARREPMLVYVFEESLLASDIETPPYGYALWLPR